MTQHSPVQNPDQILAIDGGGTRCRLALARGCEVVRVETGPANVSSNFDLAVAQIQLGLAQLSSTSGLSPKALTETPAYLGLAGMISPEIAARLREALPLSRTRIEDDRPAALRGALGAADGAIAHCGTGSFLASQINLQQRIIGGWGPQLGDQASAQWLGRLALTATLDVVDGLADPSPLSTAILARLPSPARIVAFAAAASPKDMGAFAREVTEHAASGDGLAIDLMRRGADYIATHLLKIGWSAGFRLCLTGGLAPQYSRYLPQDMQQALCQPEGDPLTGALALARDFATLRAT
jgi:glucosamine kinase